MKDTVHKFGNTVVQMILCMLYHYFVISFLSHGNLFLRSSQAKLLTLLGSIAMVEPLSWGQFSHCPQVLDILPHLTILQVRFVSLKGWVLTFHTWILVSFPTPFTHSGLLQSIMHNQLDKYQSNFYIEHHKFIFLPSPLRDKKLASLP